ncbi:MAG: tRNA (guanosine(37)-N1)-methyltransferase TrmD [Clostridia bacterium]|jgi:tRNA (guanine37-N1)-methyltransferase|nr:tRNA (guanosine(37)-N1)-methyltransferase TrmD [Clostridia bacterium]
MKIDVLTLFPEMFECIKNSILGRAINENKINLEVVNIRDFSKDKHKKCDDKPYGGGPGMVLTPQPLYDAIMETKKNFREKDNDLKLTSKDIKKSEIVINMSPKGETLNQEIAVELAEFNHLIIVCGHYEAIDERVIDLCVDKEISIGDYVLTGGEIPAMVLIDAVARYIPNVISAKSLSEESFLNGLLEYPQYTRPQNFKGLSVPEVLISGNHENIEKWKQEQSLEITKKRRKDLYKNFLKDTEKKNKAKL